MLSQNYLALTSTFLLAIVQLGSMDPVEITKVRLPNATFGAVQVWDRQALGDYYLVCADGFDDRAARAVCRSQGFSYGKSICCSALGKLDYNIGYSNIRCGGIESDLLECGYVKSRDSPTCTSGDYASVACSNDPEKEDYDLTIHPSGKVTIGHFDNAGFICAEGFDDAEATVICREKGFKGGYAYYHSRHTAYNTAVRLGVPWLSNIACNGTENSLRECKRSEWGSDGGCDENRIPAVYCYKETGFEFTLNDNGLVVFTVDGKEGSICTRKSDIKDRQIIAAVVCKQLGYRNGSVVVTDGIALPPGNGSVVVTDGNALPPGKTDMLITKVECTGDESSLSECVSRIVKHRTAFSVDWLAIPEDWLGLPAKADCIMPDCQAWACPAAVLCSQANGQLRWRRESLLRDELSCWGGQNLLAVKCFF